MRPNWSFLGICVCWAGLSVGVAAAADIANGDFESLDANGAPKGWLPANSAEASVQVEPDGNHFLRLHTVTPGKMVMVYRAIPLGPADRALELTLRVRYQDIKPGAKPWFDGRIIMNVLDADGKRLKPAPAPLYYRGTKADWQRVSRKFLVPEGAAQLELMPALFQAAAGTLDFDDLALAPIDPASVPKPLDMSSPVVAAPPADKLPPPLHVAGNRLLTPDGRNVWLQGLCVDSLEWSATGERVVRSIEVGIEQWHANVIRLPVKEEYWFGKSPYQEDGGAGYRQLVESCIHATAGRGAYLILDLHRFRAPNAQHLAFWQDVAARYRQHPAVIFELFNEPHDITWEVWRNGGEVADKVKPKEGVAVENQEVLTRFQAVGMQQLVEAIRTAGANNLIVAGGLDWSYDLSGVLRGFALNDREGGNGIMYTSHIYPWKRGWQQHVLDVAAQYPVFIGEVGNIRAWEDFPFITPDIRFDTTGWSEDMLGAIQKYQLHWTGFSFHPKCGPSVISDWDYTPTPYWGVFVKQALAGTAYPLQKIR